MKSAIDILNVPSGVVRNQDTTPEPQAPEPEVPPAEEAPIDPLTGQPATGSRLDHLNKVRARLQGAKWDKNVVIPVPVPIFSLNGIVWATPGNLSALSGASKSGKSGVTGGILASVVGREGDTLGFKSENTKGHAVLHFDTEQSAYHHDKKLQAAFRRVGMDKRDTPDWFLSYLLSGHSVNVDYLAAAMEDAATKFGGIHSVILDGAADLIVDPNNTEEANTLVSNLMCLAAFYKTHILCIIHTNPGSEKTRGHLGSQLERKAETNLTVKVDKESRVVYAKPSRDCAIPEEKGTSFCWDEEMAMFVTSEASSSDDGFGWVDLLEMLSDGPITKSDLKVTVMDSAGVVDRTFRRIVTRLKTQGFICESGLGKAATLEITEKGQKKLRDSGRVL